MDKFKRVEKCRACDSVELVPYLSFPDSPAVNRLLKSPDQIAETFEVKLLVCPRCFLSQLSVVVDPEYLYSEYAYHSSISKTWRDHCRQLAKDLRAKFDFTCDRPRLMDIASNDGCLMREFKAEEFDVMGYEPCAEMADKTQKEGLATCCGFFREVGSDVNLECQKDVITATNVLAHVDDLHGFVRGVKNYLDPARGIFVAEFPHMLNIFDYNQFDTVYHEHLSYFLLGPLRQVFKTNGLDIFRVERLEIHGGSLRIYACNSGQRPIEPSVQDCLDAENAGRMYDIEMYKEFSSWISRYHGDINTMLHFYKTTGKKVMGYGASAKGMSLINYMGVGDMVHSIVDETPYKIGKFAPGSGLPIVGFEAFEKERPDYILLLSWNFAEEMMKKTAHLGAKYIIPIPTPEVVAYQAPQESAA